MVGRASSQCGWLRDPWLVGLASRSESAATAVVGMLWAGLVLILEVCWFQLVPPTQCGEVVVALGETEAYGQLGQVDLVEQVHKEALVWVSSASKVDGEHQTPQLWAGSADGRQKNGAHQHFCSWRKFLQSPVFLAHTLKISM